MIVRQNTAPLEIRDAVEAEARGAGQRWNLSDAGPLRQFGASLETLMPGAASSDRHWHEVEDEFLLMIDGTATAIDESGAHEIGPGDAVCWPAGVPNGHQIANRSPAPCSYIIVGTRGPDEVVHYPDLQRTMIDSRETWKVIASDGSILRQGQLPDHLRGLLERPRPKLQPGWSGTGIIRAGTARIDTGTPEQNAAMGAYQAQLYSDTGGLTQFGAFVETLQPGARSSDRHWHEQEDEFLFMLTGEVTVIEDDGPHTLYPGDAACWPAGVANAHHAVNHSTAPCSYLIVGSRLPSDRVHYSDIDKLYTRIDGVSKRTKRDGTPLDLPAQDPKS